MTPDNIFHFMSINRPPKKEIYYENKDSLRGVSLTESELDEYLKMLCQMS